LVVASTVGDWHFHPGNDPRPSPADFTAWERGHQLLRAREGWKDPYYVGLILTGDPGRSGRPVIYAWTTRLENSCTAIEPAHVVVR